MFFIKKFKYIKQLINITKVILDSKNKKAKDCCHTGKYKPYLYINYTVYKQIKKIINNFEKTQYIPKKPTLG